MKNNHEILTALQYKPLYNIDSSENGVKSIQAGAYNGVGTVYSLQKCEFFLVLYILHIQRVPALHAFWDLEKTVLHEIRGSGFHVSGGPPVLICSK